MSNLSIGLVSSEDQESKTLVALLQEQGIEVTYHLTPEEISEEHTESTEVNVWLLSVDDDHWHDNIDTLLDESDASIYFNEPGSLDKEEHLEYWCRNLVSRLYEVSGLENQTEKLKPEFAESQNRSLDSQKLEQELVPVEDISIETNPVESDPVEFKPVELSSVEPNLTEGNKIEQTSIESDASISILDSALDELQTTSVGLPSDIAAELVSELEDISPELESSLENEQPVGSNDNELMDKPHLSDEIVFDESDIDEPEISELELDENSLSTEETFDFLDVAIISHEGKSHTAIDTIDTVAIKDEIDNDVYKPQASLTNRDDIEEIDFSNLSTPILESAREDDLVSVHSEYSLEEDEPESSGDDIALATSKEYIDAHEIKLQEHQELEDSVANLDSDLSVEHLGSGSKTVKEVLEEQEKEDLFATEIDLEGINTNFSLEKEEGPKPQGKADFNIEDDDVLIDDIEENKIPIVNEEIEISGLSLETEEEEVLGRADFLSDDEFEQELKELEQSQDSSNKDLAQSNLIATEDELTGLSLEPTEEVITGRAVFIEEENEALDENASLQEEQQNSLLDDALESAELALEIDEQTTGKATFEIDDSVDSNGLENGSEIDSDVNPGVSPDAMSETQNEVTNEQSDVIEVSSSAQAVTEEMNIVINEFSDSELSTESQENSFSLTIDDEPSFLSTEASIVDDSNMENSNKEELLFEIPMLEDTATNIDFHFNMEESTTPALTPCWVIGASLGGPAAVKRFMQNIPADINASFIIVQHIDENFLPVLADILTTNSHFDVKVASGSNSLKPGSVFLAPLKGKLIFLRDGSMLVDHSQSWSAPYSPCIDDVIESISSVYADKCGAIIFSGMGQDGFQGAKKLDALKGEVWAQSVETCANASMPQAVINAGLAQVVATPEMLADRLVQKLGTTQ
ncbi:MAG: hypothetical protein COB38_09210 [Gammaproteobacteria bacterium]|nr:MAG: hypothetical protein COB38_09210 [Gammaproteobacteria bacterium]